MKEESSKFGKQMLSDFEMHEGWIETCRNEK